MDWENLTVLLTGGTGSFGQQFAKTLLAESPPKRLIIFSRDEFKQSEMAHTFTSPSIQFMLGDVRDRDRVHRAMHGVDVVVHAAAMKQVLTQDTNAYESVSTNILGTQAVIDAALDRGVHKAFLISSDKAAYPINIYGSSKYCAEKLFVAANALSPTSRTRFACSRYGNVLGSRGSIVPLFLRQKALGTLTLTDPCMTRFMLTLDQAVRFVIRCLQHMVGGEIFVPRLPSVRIMDLAEVIAPGALRKIIGRRLGEKTHEALLTEDEIPRTKALDDYFLIAPGLHGHRGATWDAGKPLPPGFTYTSESNDRWLSAEEIRSMVDTLPT
jgi:UDP-N-acetylglucosamine 4,6-dehydratase/5-epimerase